MTTRKKAEGKKQKQKQKQKTRSNMLPNLTFDEKNGGKLAYIEEKGNGSVTFYFVKESVTGRLGDDWNDTPYEHNASPPYEFELKLDVQLPRGVTLPRNHYGEVTNSEVSVLDINAGAEPWLGYGSFGLYAGASVDDVFVFFGMIYNNP